MTEVQGGLEDHREAEQDVRGRADAGRGLGLRRVEGAAGLKLMGLEKAALGRVLKDEGVGAGSEEGREGRGGGRGRWGRPGVMGEETAAVPRLECPWELHPCLLCAIFSTKD